MLDHAPWRRAEVTGARTPASGRHAHAQPHVTHECSRGKLARFSCSTSTLSTAASAARRSPTPADRIRRADRPEWWGLLAGHQRGRNLALAQGNQGPCPPGVTGRSGNPLDQAAGTVVLIDATNRVTAGAQLLQDRRLARIRRGCDTNSGTSSAPVLRKNPT